MKKSNIIIAALLLALSIFLLWLWFFLGFNKVDNPVDMVASVAWWVILAVVVAAITSAESARRRAVRTVLVGPASAFNSERGVSPLKGSAFDTVKNTIDGLEYDFTKAELPQNAKELFTCAVKSATYKPAAGNESAQWKGEVIDLETGTSRQFGNEQELRTILGA